MRVAIPEYQGRVAPVFDCCRRLLIVAQSSETDDRLADEDWSMLQRSARPGRLRQLLVDLLICGGISCWMEDRIRRSGTRLIPWVAGDVWDVLAALRQGRIWDPRYCMPGRGRCKRGYQLRNPQGTSEQEENPAQKGTQPWLDSARQDH